MVIINWRLLILLYLAFLARCKPGSVKAVAKDRRPKDTDLGLDSFDPYFSDTDSSDSDLDSLDLSDLDLSDDEREEVDDSVPLDIEYKDPFMGFKVKHKETKKSSHSKSPATNKRKRSGKSKTHDPSGVKQKTLNKKAQIRPRNDYDHDEIDENPRKKRKTDQMENMLYKKILTDLNDNTALDMAGISESIRYLGSGYDIIFGNPIGDPLMMIDPGYRNPVIQLEWDKRSTFNHTNSLPQPVGGWVRPEISCKQAEKVDHVDSLEDYKKELSADASASFDFLNYFSFSASTGYKNFAQSISKNKTRSFVLKTYCLRYIAGLEISGNLKLTKPFIKSVSNLPTPFDGFEEGSSCPIDKFRADENDKDCEETVAPWMEFFKEFGTHFTSVVHLGGKMTYQIQMNLSDLNKLQEEGVNVDVAIKGTFGFGMPSAGGAVSTKSNEADKSSLSKYKVEKMIMVIGGEPPKDLNDGKNLNNWAKSVAKSPMPIKSEIIPLRELFSSDELRDSYNQAIKYYSEVYGISQDDMYEIEGKIKGIPDIIREAVQITYEGPTPGRAVCPIGTTILFGFSMTIVKKKKTMDLFSTATYDVSLVPCVVGNEKCVSGSHENALAKIWMLCSPHPGPLLSQVSTHRLEGPATIECPKGFTLGLGFGMSFPKGMQLTARDIYSCRAGQSTCTKVPDKGESTALWGVCFEAGAIEANNLVGIAAAGSSNKCEAEESINSGLVNTCPHGHEVICGFSMSLTSKFSHDDGIFKTCRGGRTCLINRHISHYSECVAYASWGICAPTEPSKKVSVQPIQLGEDDQHNDRLI